MAEENLNQGGRRGFRLPKFLRKESKAPLEKNSAMQAQEPEEHSGPAGFFQRLGSGLRRSSGRLTSRLSDLFTSKHIDEATLENLEDILIEADFGIEPAQILVKKIKERAALQSANAEEIRHILAEELSSILQAVEKPLMVETTHRPHIILMVGVNGSGKTTTIGKLTAQFAAAGKKVGLVAGDTFRAAAQEQLQIWAGRSQAALYQKSESDAAGLIFDAVKQAGEQGIDLLLIDTAGRLQNKSGLMEQLTKITRAIEKSAGRPADHVLLTLDASTGQNALAQAEIFQQSANVNGLIMTKLDGTARGGILVPLAMKYSLPIYFIGVGEGIEDLQPFSAHGFANALLGIEPAGV